ncbi:MAG: hypothetical protein KAI74_02060, partial [Kiritimatiellae bacterium]|nr:hypothetical protein [Kiritimatiellia bacterium]
RKTCGILVVRCFNIGCFWEVILYIHKLFILSVFFDLRHYFSEGKGKVIIDNEQVIMRQFLFIIDVQLYYI